MEKSERNSSLLDFNAPIPERKSYNFFTPRFSLNNDVVLPQEVKLQIEEAIAKIRFHKKIYDDWDLKSVDPTGRGIILNFYGKPGTGKTLTAEAFAGTLKKQIIIVGIAELESKFMGDTAKNIQEIFRAAQGNEAVLFFDEADTLLGKRLSSVTQGVDNEVNASRSTMLIEIEKYEGIVIFSTNFAENYDKAFESRISHHIHFPLPDLECRKQLWQKHITHRVPLAEDREEIISKAAELSAGLSGRDIRNVMRIALPKLLLEAETNKTAPLLTVNHLADALAVIKIAHKNVGKEVNPEINSDLTTIRNLYGLNKTEKEN